MASRYSVCFVSLAAACAWWSCVACVAYTFPAHGANLATASRAISANEHGLDLVANPYAGNADAIAEGAALFESSACSGCHGASAEGGACPSLVNAAWVYGSDDTTLFNLIKRGSAALRAKGYARSGNEKSAGDMPPFAGMLSDEDTWKLIAWIRSKYSGDPALRNW